MANVLNNEKKQQILALGKLGWSLRRIQAATHVRRETISTYLKAAGVGVWPPGGWGRQTVSKPAIGVTTDFGVELSTPRPENQDLVAGDSAKPAIEVTTGFGVELRDSRSEKTNRNPSTASAGEPFQEAIELGLSRGRNAMAIWQDLVSEHGFTSSYQSVKRYIHKRRGSQLPQTTAVILTAPGEEAQVDYGTGPMVRDPHRGK
jgi:transposase